MFLLVVVFGNINDNSFAGAVCNCLYNSSYSLGNASLLADNLTEVAFVNHKVKYSRVAVYLFIDYDLVGIVDNRCNYVEKNLFNSRMPPLIGVRENPLD